VTPATAAAAAAAAITRGTIDIHIDDRFQGAYQVAPEGRGHECRGGTYGEPRWGEGVRPIPDSGQRGIEHAHPRARGDIVATFRPTGAKPIVFYASDSPAGRHGANGRSRRRG